ncbi:hypothetical protein [Roseibium alexandrii]|uniref:Glycerophosphoryl diester phosphodiesterase membrane domain-containing protein n=1 Tax=Roseibium alexandrii (strain DSM 17067 / NCIMB 14079 / DFL-11) TaxID=244592 RepID=A0A5E8H1W5_ROSAD|nr:hypothetical protein [Roseibium alexandrii]EEE46538.1 hypothetical protein SADFL11_3827 [Roseibium alexandrii DFL-11]
MLKRLLSDAASLVFGHLETVFKVCGAWFLIQFVISILILTATTGVPADAETLPPAAGLLLMTSTLVALISSASISVAWHRFGLLGERVGNIYLRFGRIEIQFIWRMLLIGLFGFAVSLPLVFVAFMPSESASGLAIIALVLGFALVIMPFLMRLNLVLPATAIERPIGFGEALRIGKGLGWRMLLAIVVLSLPFVLVTMGLQWALTVVSIGLPALFIQIKVMILNVLLQIIVTVLGISVITAGYRMAMERQTQSAQS